MKLVAIPFAAIVFYEAFVVLKSLSSLSSVQDSIARSFEIVRSTSMSDEEKAAGMQSLSLATLKGVAAIVGKISIAALASMAALYIASFVAGPFLSLVAYSTRPVPIAATIAAILLYAKLRHGGAR